MKRREGALAINSSLHCEAGEKRKRGRDKWEIKQREDKESEGRLRKDRGAASTRQSKFHRRGGRPKTEKEILRRERNFT